MLYFNPLKNKKKNKVRGRKRKKLRILKIQKGSSHGLHVIILISITRTGTMKLIFSCDIHKVSFGFISIFSCIPPNPLITGVLILQHRKK
jgi:hypothetical protein